MRWLPWVAGAVLVAGVIADELFTTVWTDSPEEP
jgi:hypothetical protein